jgi:hypothetical protein
MIPSASLRHLFFLGSVLSHGLTTTPLLALTFLQVAAVLDCLLFSDGFSDFKHRTDNCTVFCISREPNDDCCITDQDLQTASGFSSSAAQLPPTSPYLKDHKPKEILEQVIERTRRVFAKVES